MNSQNVVIQAAFTEYFLATLDNPLFLEAAILDPRKRRVNLSPDQVNMIFFYTVFYMELTKFERFIFILILCIK